MPTVNITSKDFEKLGINLKDILLAVTKADKTDNKYSDIIKIKKRKRKNKNKNKKIKKSITQVNPLQNNKPHFMNKQLNSGGGAGIISSTNPMYQRAPPVTTVINSQPNDTNNNELTKTVNSMVTENKNRFAILDKQISDAHNRFEKNLDINFMKGIRYITDIIDPLEDNVGFEKESYRVTMTQPPKKEYSLTNISSSSMIRKNPEVDTTDSAGNIPLNAGPVDENQNVEVQPEQDQFVENTNEPEAEQTEQTQENTIGTEFNYGQEFNYGENPFEFEPFDPNEMQVIRQPTLDGDNIDYPDDTNSGIGEEYKIDDEVDDPYDESWRVRDQFTTQLAEQEKEAKRIQLADEKISKKEERQNKKEVERTNKLKEYAQKKMSGITPKGKAPAGWEQYYTPPDTKLTSESIKNTPKFTNDNTKLSQVNESKPKKKKIPFDLKNYEVTPL